MDKNGKSSEISAMDIIIWWVMCEKLWFGENFESQTIQCVSATSGSYAYTHIIDMKKSVEN